MGFITKVDVRSPNVLDPFIARSFPGKDRRVGNERYETAATPWCSATTSTMSPMIRLTWKSLGV